MLPAGGLGVSPSFKKPPQDWGIRGLIETISALSSVIGGGIAGSVTARFSVEHGFKTLLLERYRAPKNKLCSVIQFPHS